MFMVKTIGTFMTQFERRCHALDTQMQWIGKDNFTEQQQLRIEELVNSIDNPKALQHDLAIFPVWARTIIKNALHHENVD